MTTAPPSTDAPRSAAEAIPEIMTEIYAAFLRGDTTVLDSHLSDDVTIWVPSEYPISLGKAGLDAMRSRRPADAGVNTATAITVHEMRVDSWQEVAWVRHVLVVEYADEEPEIMRVSGVWRLIDGQWLQVHSHEDGLPGASYPFDRTAVLA